jgi:GT2 family glycosyltransferase
MKKCRIYAVHYGENTIPTHQLIESLKPFLCEHRELVIVNNSRDVDLTNLINDHISIICPEKNLGYFGAVKYGTDCYPYDKLDYIIVCNNDIQFASPDFFDIADEKLNYWDVIAPSTKTLDGIEQNPHREAQPSTLRKLYYRIYFANYLAAWLFDKAYTIKELSAKSIRPEPTEHAIFSPHGACVILNSTYFKQGGYIEDGSYLYGEEDSIAALALKYKLKIGFVPSLKILHLESQSTGKGLPRKKYHFQKTAYYFIAKKYPWLYK